MNTNLQGANLKSVDLYRGLMLDADLEDANLTGANLQRAKLEGAKLEGADLTDAIWVNGQKCLAGSIGKCIQESNKQPPKNRKREGAKA